MFFFFWKDKGYGDKDREQGQEKDMKRAWILCGKKETQNRTNV